MLAEAGGGGLADVEIGGAVDVGAAAAPAGRGGVRLRGDVLQGWLDALAADGADAANATALSLTFGDGAECDGVSASVTLPLAAPARLEMPGSMPKRAASHGDPSPLGARPQRSGGTRLLSPLRGARGAAQSRHTSP